MCKKPEGVDAAAFINGSNIDYSKQEMRFYCVKSQKN
jgi:hypothetical protein